MDLKALAFLDIYSFVHTPDLYSAGGENLDLSTERSGGFRQKKMKTRLDPVPGMVHNPLATNIQ